MITYFHGTNQPAKIVDAIIGSGRIRAPFHMTHDIDVARNYGNHVVRIEMEEDVKSARVGRINKENNYNANVGDAIETVIADPKAVNDFYYAIYNAEIA